MKREFSVRYASIYYKGKMLSIEVETYKTRHIIYIYDKSKAIPFLDKCKCSRQKEPGLYAREYAIANNLFCQ